jgi:8-oxo-dGTP diphosphatase
MLMSPQTATAAVAIIKSLAPNESVLVLRRASHPQDPWSGHFSFPGGRSEKKDNNLLSTCIRETREETGIPLDADQLQQRLPLEPAGRNFKSPLWVQPFLFILPKPQPLTLDQREIRSGCWVDIERFQNLELHEQVEMLPGHFFPAYPLEDYYLWGFTYRLLCSILQIESDQK